MLSASLLLHGIIHVLNGHIFFRFYNHSLQCGDIRSHWQDGDRSGLVHQKFDPAAPVNPEKFPDMLRDGYLTFCGDG